MLYFHHASILDVVKIIFSITPSNMGGTHFLGFYQKNNVISSLTNTIYSHFSFKHTLEFFGILSIFPSAIGIIVVLIEYWANFHTFISAK